MSRTGSAGAAPATVLAAGAVLWRRTPDGVEIAVVHRPRYDDWSLPKGKLDPDESMPTAAVREIAEETGCAARLGPVLGETRYPVTDGHKTVRYWAAEAVGVYSAFVPDSEVDVLRWVRPEEAADLVTYSQDRELVERFGAIGVPTGVVLLVRHAKAGRRDRWSGDDDLRPLSDSGRDQARKLCDMLALFGPDRIVAAPPLRCRDTVEPLALALDLPVAVEPLFGETGYADDPEGAVHRLLDLAGHGGVTVVCSQGGAVPGMIGALARTAARDVDVEPDEVPSKKGSTWLLALRDHTLVAADYYEHPASS